MSELERLIQELCPNGVEFKKISDVCDISRGQVISKDFIKENAGEYPVYSSQTENNGQLGAISAYMFDGKYLTWTTDGANAGTVFYREGKFSVTNVCGVIDVNDSNVNVRFLYFVLNREAPSYVNRGMGNPKLMSNVMIKIKVPVPPLEVQREIVRILDNFTELTAELQAELQARKKQYEYYNNILLSFDNAEYKTLEELCDIVDYRGKTPRKVDDGIFLVTAKNIRKGFIDYDKSKEYISPEDYDEVMHRGLPKIGDVLITTEAPCGNVAQIDNENIALAQRVIKYRPKSNNLNSTFLKYVLLGKEFQDKLERAATGGTVKGIKGSKLHQLTIPVPSIEEQEHIVAILDRFDTLCNDISEGLPAEIEARQKQYEYYRDKLLTFTQLA